MNRGMVRRKKRIRLLRDPGLRVGDRMDCGLIAVAWPRTHAATREAERCAGTAGWIADFRRRPRGERGRWGARIALYGRGGPILWVGTGFRRSSEVIERK